jgi:hypothetical protein
VKEFFHKGQRIEYSNGYYWVIGHGAHRAFLKMSAAKRYIDKYLAQ